MFLHLSVILFTGGCAWQGGMCGRGDMHGGGHAWGACVAGGACMAGGGMCGRGACMVGGAWQGGMHATHAPLAIRDIVSQCMGGTHPTGMHSCLKHNSIHYYIYSSQTADLAV